MRIAIIGAGLQARRRAPVIKDWPDSELVIITAKTKEEAEPLARKMGCEAGEGWETVVTRPDIDIVLVCTPPDIHAAISIAALKSGKHVLCEKPLTRTVAEAEKLIAYAQSTGLTFKVRIQSPASSGHMEGKRTFRSRGVWKPGFWPLCLRDLWPSWL